MDNAVNCTGECYPHHIHTILHHLHNPQRPPHRILPPFLLLDCPVGFASSKGASECSACEPGRIAAISGSSRCAHCDVVAGNEYTSAQGMGVCNKCRPGFYWHKSTCNRAKDGTACVADGTTLATLDIKKGWYRFATSSDKLYECPVKDACAGSGVQNGNASAGISNASLSSAEYRASLCGRGYVGAICSACDKMFYADTITRECMECETNESGERWFILAGIFLLFVIAIRYVPRQVKRAKNVSVQRRF